MPRRKEHNIESNCVTFEDDCYSQDNYLTIDKKEKQFIYRTGERFVNYLKELLGVQNEQRD